MPLQNLLMVAVLFAVIALFLAFSDRIVGAFQRFEARNAARRAEEARAMFDRYAHYRQTVALAEEQVEEITKFRTKDARTGEPIERFIFLGTQYAPRREAEAARHDIIVEKAREFYLELDKMYLSRRGWREPRGEPKALTDESKRETVKPPRP
jgi:isocitrate dehydrogenase kinase/phosphatase